MLVNISVGHPERWWPPERFVPVLSLLRKRLPKATIILSSMPEDHEIAERLAAPVGAKAVPLSLHRVIAVVASADLLLSPDTSITHAASSFQTPTMTLQRKDTGHWSPYKTPGRTVFSDDPKSLIGLPADRVVRALDELIGEMGPSRGWL